VAASQSAPGIAAAAPQVELKAGETYRRLLRYVRPYWWIVVAAVIPAALYAVVGTAVPLLLGDFVKQLQDATRGSENAWRYPVLIALGFPIRGAMDVLTVYGLAWVGRSVIRDLRSEVFAHYLGLPARYFDQGSSGVLISRITYNTEMVAEAISNAVVIMLRDSLAVLTLLVVMIWYSPRLTLTVAVLGPVVVFVVALMSRAFRRYSARIQASMGDVTRLTEQSLHGHRVVKVFEGQEHERQQFQDVNTRNFRFNVRIVAVHAVGDALTQYAIALGVAAVMYLSFGDMDPASFLGFVTAMGMLLTPLKRLVNINSIVQRAITAAAGVFEILDQPKERDTGALPLARARGDVSYRNVSFRYESGKERALRDVSLDVAAGTTVALVGQSGSGKTTLVSLLPRFYDPDHGAVLLDGRDIREYSLRDLRRQIALVGQDVVLFDDTIARNIAYGALAKLSRGDVGRAAEAAYVTEFAASLPQGLDTRVGERGALLSGGQRQRIAIARALLKDAPLLILDEATSALDTESERRVQAALAGLMRGRTTLVVAHRLSTVERADRIVAMRDGNIVESGTHTELLARGGYYASLYNMQFTV
jgi:ATP-binding cassette, subfamily B, bacterial MsbA